MPKGGENTRLKSLLGAGERWSPGYFPVAFERNGQVALLARFERGTGGAIGFAGTPGKGNFYRTRILNFEVVMVGRIVGDLLRSEAGAGIVYFDQLHRFPGVIDDRGLHKR